ncbi:MAG: hypothetical protein OHK0046_16920 [Anaerolineae bacterium]
MRRAFVPGLLWLLFLWGVAQIVSADTVIRRHSSITAAREDEPQAAEAITPSTLINTAGWTDSPFMTPDGQQLYFMYTPYNFFPWILGTGDPERRGPERPGHHTNPDSNPWGDSDIYVSERQPDGTWSAPVNLPFNDDGADACGMLRSDGGAFYWQKGQGSADLFVAYKAEDGTWADAIDLGAPINLPDSHEVNPHISADDNTLWFSSDRAGGYGAMDIYVSTRQPDGAWGEPVNLGPEINGEGGDDQIWVSEDGQTAYFNRDMAIFSMQREGEGWSTPEPIVFENGVFMAAEVSFTADGQTMIVAVPDVTTERLLIMESHLLPDGQWSAPQPVD